MYSSPPPPPTPPPPPASAAHVVSGPMTEADLEPTLLALYHGLTEMQASAASTAKGDEANIARAASTTMASIAQLAQMKPVITTKVPMDVLDLIDQSKNPHQHTRDIIERAAGENQFTHGKLAAVESYRKMLESSLFDQFPDLRTAMLDADNTADAADKQDAK